MQSWAYCCNSSLFSVDHLKSYSVLVERDPELGGEGSSSCRRDKLLKLPCVLCVSLCVPCENVLALRSTQCFDK